MKTIRLANCMAMLAAGLLVGGSALAQAQTATVQITVPAPPPTAPTPAAPADTVAEPVRKPSQPGPLRLYLLDGSIITGQIALEQFTVQTQFGTLKVPVKSIVSFTPGLDSHPNLDKQINELIEKLGSSEITEREAAQKELSKMGPSIRGALQKYTKDDDAERRLRVQALLDEMQEAVADDEGPKDATLIEQDSLETTEFTMVGRIQPTQFQVTNTYGTLTIKLSDVRVARRDGGEKEEIRKSFDVQGMNLFMTNWKDPGIRVEKGDSVSVTADGTVTLSPWGSRAMSTPEGAANYGMAQPGNLPLGCLVARVGDGQPFKIGSKSTFTADRAGKLQFGMAMMPEYANNQFPGKYDVKVRVEHK
ncbi:MAG: hypothetical protein WD042_12590 [Phycisphaeraceae bacterium]